MMRYKLLIFLVFALTISKHSYGQGCSDAGVCSLDKLKPTHSMTSEFKNQAKVGIGYGNADHSISIIAPYLEYNRLLGDNTSLTARLTTLSQNGNSISAFGMSDLFLVGNYRVTDNLISTFGVKLPLTDGNYKIDGLSLPMDYQSSLGTIDILLGLSYAIKDLQIALAYQQPLTQNKNEFLASDYPLESDLTGFQSSNKYQRKGDLMLRLSYPLSLSEKLILTPSILSFYHLGNDKFTDEFNFEQEISSSDGLTLNATAILDYHLNSSNILQLNFGFPMVVREARPDGLTRSFVVNLEYQISF